MRRLLGIADPLKQKVHSGRAHYLGFLIHACQVQVSRKSLVDRIVADQADVIGYADACLPERILQAAIEPFTQYMAVYSCSLGRAAICVPIS